MKFTKMQGTGNDYVYISCFDEPFPQNPGELSVRISDRHFGVGSDGLIFICPSEIADFKMIMYNYDGSRSQMCGNGIRCVGKYVYDMGLTNKEEIAIETSAGIKYLKLNVIDGSVKTIQVNMGAPVLDPKLIPVAIDDSSFINKPIYINGRQWNITAVSMGNPHAVIFVDEVRTLKLDELGPLFEKHPLFPERTNTEFAKVLSRETIEMRVWERGAGETLSCGTGCCATLVAAVLNGYTDRKASINILGGSLEIQWDQATDQVFMTGPAEFVFSGNYH